MRCQPIVLVLRLWDTQAARNRYDVERRFQRITERNHDGDCYQTGASHALAAMNGDVSARADRASELADTRQEPG